ncbi:MAG: hypothetical protein AVDCRST_MAG11-1045 [uncultured Gemmatimonadaceae bacterium]|uniref:Uncharacterized protein n=1 Tax=uncultured Gemmatimonadaceae bacterium TaxID=246130 RepID=A0A6J4KEY1_9BACT|nr:MAG: hypothetical protein AVDCRST_MAG11-1045 [uncultured Gemmatimonadaceae bacterium]
MAERSSLYTRPLPGGGYVEIDQTGDPVAGFCVRLRVERRADPQRRAGHQAPVIATAEGTEPGAAVAELREIAASNVSVAQRIQRWQTGRG